MIRGPETTPGPGRRHRARRHPWRRATVLLGASLLLGATSLGSAATASGRPHQIPRAVSSTVPPLAVALTSLTPGAVPTSGPITMTGTVTNTSRHTWTAITVSPFVSTTPLVSRYQLALADQSDPTTTYVGPRLGDPALTSAVGDLKPGQTAPFTVQVPREDLPISGAPGVYWIGVQALGTDDQGVRDEGADGRARTFIPLLPSGRVRPTPVSIVLPLRERVRYAADGSLNGPSRWAALTGTDGRLARLAAFGTSAGPTPVSWETDPAVLDALQAYAAGNHGLSLGSAARRPSTPAPSSSSSSSGGASPTTSLPPAPSSGRAPTRDQRAAASAVLTGLLGVLASSDVLTLGYADPDVAAVVRRRPGLLAHADTLAAQKLQARGITGTPTIAPVDGALDPALLRRLPASSLLLLTGSPTEENLPSTRLASGQQLVLADERASSGGPAPARAFDPLAIRQRVLSDAALEAIAPTLAGRPRPLVVTFPALWDPGAWWPAADFFGALSASRWLRVVQLDRSGTTAFVGRTPFTRQDRAAELPSANVDAAVRLLHSATVLGHLLDNTNDVSAGLGAAALSAASYQARPSPRQAVQQTDDLDGAVHRELDRVTVTGTDPVTLSGGSGVLTVTVVNGLAQPVVVGLRAYTDSRDVTVQPPTPVSLGAHERATVRLQATSRAGVHEVTLEPVTLQGEAAGKAFSFSLRTSAVGMLIWYFIGAAVLVLAVRITRRVRLRIDNRRWRIPPEPAAPSSEGL